MKLEPVFNEIYGNGRYQVFLVLLCAMNGVITMFDLHLNTFMLYRPNQITCNTDVPVTWITKNAFLKLQRNQSISLPESLSNDQCYGIQDNMNPFECTEWSFSTDVMISNILTEYQLVCGRSYLNTWIKVIYLTAIPSGYIFAMQSDRFSRQTIFLSMLTIQIIANALTPLIKNLYLLIVFIYLRAFTGCLNYMGMTQIVELLPISKRSMYVSLYWGGWCTGNVLCPLMTYWLRDWRSVKYTLILLSVTHPLLYYLFPRSPRWLLVHGRDNEALNVLRRIISFNRPTLPENYIDDLKQKLAMIKLVEKDEAGQESLIDGFKNRLIGMRLLVFAFCHTTVIFCYIGLMISITYMSENIYLNGVLTGAVEYPGVIVPWLMASVLGRRLSCFLLMLLCGSAVMVTPFLGSVAMAKIVVGMIGKAALYCAYGTVDLYLVELMPTSIRSSGCFFSMMIGAVTSIITPVANDYLKGEWAIIVYGAGVVCGGLLIFATMPETKGLPLAETIEESQGFSRGNEAKWADQLLENRPKESTHVL